MNESLVNKLNKLFDSCIRNTQHKITSYVHFDYSYSIEKVIINLNYKWSFRATYISCIS